MSHTMQSFIAEYLTRCLKPHAMKTVPSEKKHKFIALGNHMARLLKATRKGERNRIIYLRSFNNRREAARIAFNRNRAVHS